VLLTSRAVIHLFEVRKFVTRVVQDRYLRRDNHGLASEILARESNVATA